MVLNKITRFLLLTLLALAFTKQLIAQEKKQTTQKATFTTKDAARSNYKNTSTNNTSEEGSEINVKNAELESIIKLFGKKTKRNYILDERVKGKVSIYLPGKVATDEAINILDAVLQLKGFTTVPIGKNIWKVIPAKDAKQTTIPTITEIEGRGSASVVTRFINLKYVAADDVKQLLTPLISSFGLMNAYTPTNSLIIIDAEENIKRLIKLVDEMDVPFSNREMVIIPVRYAVASELATTIKELLGEDSDTSKQANEQNLDFVRTRMRMQNNIRRNAESNQHSSADMGQQTALTVGAARSRAPKILADDRTNSIIVVADEDTTTRIRALVSELDSSVDLAGMNFYVYKCIHANANELAEVLSTVANGGGSTNTGNNSSSFGSSFSRNSSNNSRNRDSKYRFGSNSNTKDSSSSTSSKNNNSQNSRSSTNVTFGDELSITSDPATNSLVIYATKSDYDKIIALIKELDVKRRQVLVEALLLEVQISDSVSTSTSFLSSGGGSDGGLVASNNGGSIMSMLTDPSQLSSFTLAVASAGTLSFGDSWTLPSQTMMLSAASQNNNVNVLSAPTILTTDNEEAEIVVGENVPFLSSTASSSENLSNTFNSIDRQDVGITLRLTPQISSRDYVKLNIFTEVSNVISDTAASALGPTTTIRTSQTTVIAKDSQMIVIGGLIGENVEENNSGVPFLKDIPVLGHLFKSHSNSNERNNLLIFITPRIIKDQFDIRDSSIELRNDFNDFIDNNQIYPDRKKVLYNKDIDRVIESRIYEGELPGTILPPSNIEEAQETAQETEVITETKKQKKPLTIKVKPIGDTTRASLQNNKEIAKKDIQQSLQSAQYIVLKPKADILPAQTPFSLSEKGTIGIVIPEESNLKAKSFFKAGNLYQYRMKNQNIDLEAIEILSKPEQATITTSPDSWYILSPFELMRLGKTPWLFVANQ